MRLVRSRLFSDELSAAAWHGLANALRKNKGFLGDLGGGNHFVDALAPYEGSHLHLLIHTGSRLESGLVDGYVDHATAFDQEFSRIVSWAEENRATIQAVAEAELGPLELILDLPHNTFEPLAEGGAIVRKGAVHVKPGDLNIIPSHMAGDVALVKATGQVAESLESLSHGTGRAMSRGDCKPLAVTYDFNTLRKRVMIPSGIQNSSLRTEGPFAYRDLDACLELMTGYVELVERFAVVAYMGHL
jgi:RNA-splicing ligase RtcB